MNKSQQIMLGLVAAFAITIAGVAHTADKSDKKSTKTKTETAIFAGGCFWCMEKPFDDVKGVISTTSGYTGGTKKNPTYHEVGSGTTGHCESMEVEFDPSKVTYETLLQVYWHNIDPTQENGQFCDHGNQYRAEIFYLDDAQKAAAEASKKDVEKKFGFCTVNITPASTFYPAEEYHQDFYMKDPDRYHEYRSGCGRDRRLKELWGADAGIAHAMK
ncbi:MAG TPA: peptide-methionine (S)-S-oxide reductase MsrA [Candidatus Krumholzibacteria bacterium]|nr:peptide-methionine (S)-S-oxide reductase MsrA [Candidatus Krumholzibacteria bacterium]